VLFKNNKNKFNQATSAFIFIIFFFSFIFYFSIFPFFFFLFFFSLSSLLLPPQISRTLPLSLFLSNKSIQFKSNAPKTLAEKSRAKKEWSN
jgi:ABC-type multidrug transport system permease subunit